MFCDHELPRIQQPFNQPAAVSFESAGIAEQCVSLIKKYSMSGTKMLRFVDTHTHVNMILKRMQLSTVQELMSLMPDGLLAAINVNCSLDSIDEGLELQTLTPLVFGTYGLHPHLAGDWSEDLESKLRQALGHSKSVAVGECGLDYYRNNQSERVQKNAFVNQMEIAMDTGLPLVVHSRDAEEHTMEMLKFHIPLDWRIHLHCFTGSVQFAKEFMDSFPNGVIGFTGCVTFSNAENIRNVVEYVPLEKIVLETDGPFMTPVPYRGKPCYSAYIPLIGEAIAKVKRVESQTVFDVTTQNAKTIYSLDI